MSVSYKPYPMLLSPYVRNTLWGGTRLTEKYDKTAPSPDIAEAWELSACNGESSVIANGIYAGVTLYDYIERYHSVGTYSANEFPLLIKLIDAKDKLSIQLHPDDDAAVKAGFPRGKNELWYIIEADPGAEIIYGVSDVAKLKAMLGNGSLSADCMPLFRHIPVHAGDVFFVPAGLVHAIGGGILIAEIQQNCDLTYRIYDYGRGRELHLDAALNSIKDISDSEIKSLQYKRGSTPGCIASSDFFTVFRHNISVGGILAVNSERDFTCILCTRGKAVINHNKSPYPISAGQTYLLPRGIGDANICGYADNAEILEITV